MRQFKIAMRLPQQFYRYLVWFVSAVLGILLLVQPVSMAQSIEDWRDPTEQQANRGWIHDRANLLDWQTEIHLALRINKLVGRTSAELAIVTLPKVESRQSLRAFGLALFNAWEIGSSDRNNGLLLLVSQADRRIEIITGSGLDTVLPEAELSRLIQQEIALSFAQQQYALGIIKAVNTIAQRLESRLPSTIFPHWMPNAMVWLPWLMAIGGAGWAMVSTVRVLLLSVTSVRVIVPMQGFASDIFPSSQMLSSYPLATILAHVSAFKGDRGEAKIPNLIINILIGSWLVGLGLMYGLWQFILLHPGAGFWQSDRIVGMGFAMAGAISWLWALLVASRFITRELLLFSYPLSLLIVALQAGLACLMGYSMTTAWSSASLIGMILILFSMLLWETLIGQRLGDFIRKRKYCSDRTGMPPQELSIQELETVLTPKEITARSLGKLEFRGWREAELILPLTRDQVYLLQRIDSSASVCAHCKSYAVDVSDQTIERTIEINKKRDSRRQKKVKDEGMKNNTEKVTAVRLVKQKVYSCHFCGCIFAYDQREQPMAYSSDSSYYSSSDSNSGYSNSSTDSNISTSSYDSSYSSDYDGSSSDFGGGSSDGGGAGGDW